MAKKTTSVQPVERKQREKIDPNETPENRFRRLAGKRLAVARKMIHLLGNLATGYKYTQEQVDKIRSTLEDDVKAAMGKFNPSKAASNGKKDFTVEL